MTKTPPPYHSPVFNAKWRLPRCRHAAAIFVWRWLARRGQSPTQCGLRPKLRIVCERL